MPQLPSGLEVIIANLAIVDLEGRQDWFCCPEGQFWFMTPNLTVSPPPYGPREEIQLDFLSAPVPNDYNEATEFVQVLIKDPVEGIFWRGDWLPDFHETYPLRGEDQKFWFGWLEEKKDFLDHVISSAQMQSYKNRDLSGKYGQYWDNAMIGMQIPSHCLGNEIVEDRIFMYPLSQVLERSHRLPSSLQQLDYELAVKIVGEQLIQEGHQITQTVRDYSANISLLAEGPEGPIAVKVISNRAPNLPECSARDVDYLKQFEAAEKYFIAPVSLMRNMKRSPEGAEGFFGKYEGLVEV